MSVLVILIAASILIAGGFLAAFLWSVRSGQYDDDYTPSVRMLFDNPGGTAASGNASAKKPATNQQTDK
jgi:cbb3-type cytochrome oxidase maturation protein